MSSTIKRILVPVDGSVSSTKATEQAAYFAKACDAVIDFLYVASDVHKDIPSDIVFDEMVKKVPNDIKYELHTASGNIARKVVEVAEELGDNIIIMGSRGLGIFRGALIGSVSQKVIEESRLPVMVVKQNQR